MRLTTKESLILSQMKARIDFKNGKMLAHSERYTESYNWLLEHETYHGETTVTDFPHTVKLPKLVSWIDKPVIHLVDKLDEDQSP